MPKGLTGPIVPSLSRLSEFYRRITGDDRQNERYLTRNLAVPVISEII
jgi:hypothetical protein